MTPSATSTPRTTVLCLRSLFVSLDIFPIANSRESISAALASPLNHSRPKRPRQRANATANLIVMPKSGEACTRFDRPLPASTSSTPSTPLKFSRTTMTDRSQKIRNAHWKMFRIGARAKQFTRPFGQVTRMEPSRHRIEAIPCIEWYCGGSTRGGLASGVDMAVTLPYCFLTFPDNLGSSSCSRPPRALARSMVFDSTHIDSVLLDGAHIALPPRV